MGVFFVWIFVGALNGSIHFLNRTIFWGYFRKHGFKKKVIQYILLIRFQSASQCH